MNILDLFIWYIFDGQYGIPILAVYRTFFTKNQVRRPSLSPAMFKRWGDFQVTQ